MSSIYEGDVSSLYEGDVEDDQRNGKGKLFVGGKLVYDGGFYQNQKHGFGYLFKDGIRVFEGNFANNQKNGYGKEYKDGSIFVGNFKRGVRDGKGTLTLPDGTEKKGRWKRGYMVKGTIRKNGKLIYKGELHRNAMHGKGYHVLENGDSFKGTFENNHRKSGFIKYSNGHSYEGEFNQLNCKHGQGTYIWDDGSMYKGGWKDDLRSGYGTMYTPEGDTLEGTWRDGKAHGHGILNGSLHQFSDGKISVSTSVDVLFLGSNGPISPASNVVAKTRTRGAEYLDGVTIDLRNLQELFKEKAHMSYHYTSNCSSNIVILKIREFLDKDCSTNPFAQFMIIYSGHGTTPSCKDGGNWVFKEGYINYITLEREWKSSKAYQTNTTRLILLIDTCFSGFWIEELKAQSKHNPEYRLRTLIQTSSHPLELSEDTKNGGKFLYCWIRKQNNPSYKANLHNQHPNLSVNSDKIRITNDLTLFSNAYYQ